MAIDRSTTRIPSGPKAFPSLSLAREVRLAHRGESCSTFGAVPWSQNRSSEIAARSRPPRRVKAPRRQASLLSRSERRSGRERAIVLARSVARADEVLGL